MCDTFFTIEPCVTHHGRLVGVTLTVGVAEETMVFVALTLGVTRVVGVALMSGVGVS